MADLSGPAANYVLTLQGNQPQTQIDGYRRLTPAQQREVRQWLATRPEAGPLATRFDGLMQQIGQPRLDAMGIRADSSLFNDRTRAIHDLLRGDPRTAGMFTRNADLGVADLRTMRDVVEQRALAKGTSYDAYEAWSGFLRDAVDAPGGLDFRFNADAVRQVGRDMGTRGIYPASSGVEPLMAGHAEADQARGRFHDGIVGALRDLRVPRGEIGAGTIDQIKSAVQGERFGEYLRDFALNPDSPFRLQNLSQGARERLAREAGAAGLDRSLLARIGGTDARAVTALETHFRSGVETAARAAAIQRDGIQQGMPKHVSDRFNVRLENDQQTLTVDPAAPRIGTRSAARVTDSWRGGKNIAFGPEEAPFTITGARWENTTIGRVLPNITAEQRARLGNIDLSQPVSAMRVSVSNPNEGDTLLVYQPNSNTVSTICLGSGQVGSFDIRAPGRISLRKPVVYFYPETRTTVTMRVAVKGDFTATYPAPRDGAWRMVATPDGTLFDPVNERKYAYLFWEAATDGFVIDRAKAHCVSGRDAAAFLEQVASAFALNAKEATDFITYWLPHLERNDYNVVQLLSPTAIEEYAAMHIEPGPETVIRLYMMFEAAAEPVAVGAPALPEHRRKGFTVVEWGGCDLDERV